MFNAVESLAHQLLVHCCSTVPISIGRNTKQWAVLSRTKHILALKFRAAWPLFYYLSVRRASSVRRMLRSGLDTGGAERRGALGDGDVTGREVGPGVVTVGAGVVPPLLIVELLP